LRAKAVTATLRIGSVAVLPFENLSGDPAQEYFADGMTDELTTNLGKISELRVISRTSVMTYKQSRKPLVQIARELNVDAIVEGAVKRSGSHVHVTANLLYAPGDRHLWACTYESDLGDVLILQSTMARSIADEIGIKLLSEEQTRLARARPVNPEAHEAYLRAWYLLNGRTTQGVERAIGYFQQAIDKEPSYAPAYGGLGVAYYLLPIYADWLPKDANPKAKQAAEAALAIDANQADAYTARGWVEAVYEYRWKDGEADLKRGVELNPSNSNARIAYGMVLIFLNRHSEAIEQLQRALENDPLSPFVASFLGYGMFLAHRDGEAETVLQRALELDPNFHLSLAVLALVYAHEGKQHESTEAIERAVRVAGDSVSGQTARKAYVYAVSGRTDEARSIAARLSHPAPGKYVPAYYLAAISLALNNRESAFRFLDQAYEAHDFMLPFLGSDPIWDPVRTQERFKQIVRRMSFPD